MLLLIIRVLFACVSIGAIAAYVSITPKGYDGRPLIIQQHPVLAFAVMLLLTQFATFIDLFVRKKRIEIISAIYFGLMIGYLLSYLLMLAIQNNLQESYREPVRMMAALILPIFASRCSYKPKMTSGL
jgi:uncharacterized protein YacL